MIFFGGGVNQGRERWQFTVKSNFSISHPIIPDFMCNLIHFQLESPAKLSG